MTNVVERRPGIETDTQKGDLPADATRPLPLPGVTPGHGKHRAQIRMRAYRSPEAKTAGATAPVVAPVPAAAAAAGTVAAPRRAPQATWRPATRASGPGHPVLPVPPDDSEKYSYIRRHSWLLVLGSLASFPLLLWSQMRLMAQYHWF